MTLLYKTKLKKIIFKIPAIIEIFIGLLISVVIIFAIVGVVTDTSTNSIFEDGGLMIFLQRITEIIIGIEFVKLIFSHTLDATLEVIIMAIVRQIIVQHLSPIDTLLYVVAISILFIARKYFFIKKLDEDHGEVEYRLPFITSIKKEATDNSQVNSKENSSEK